MPNPHTDNLNRVYEGFVNRTNKFPNNLIGLLLITGKMQFEAGEAFQELERFLMQRYGIPYGDMYEWFREHPNWLDQEIQDAYLSELGDVLWYLQAALGVLGLSIEDLMSSNMEKLTKRRAENGTSTES